MVEKADFTKSVYRIETVDKNPLDNRTSVLYNDTTNDGEKLWTHDY